MIHPEKPGVVKIGLSGDTLEQCLEEDYWGDWEVHRYRNVEEPLLAESLITLGRIGLENSSVEEIDVNPLKFRDGRPVAVDALVVLSDKAG